MSSLIPILEDSPSARAILSKKSSSKTELETQTQRTNVWTPKGNRDGAGGGGDQNEQEVQTKEDVHVLLCWLTFLYNRNYHNIVEDLYSNKS